jgi:hypothetical protein
MADKFKSIAKGGWHPERDRANNSDGQSGGRLGQVVWSPRFIPSVVRSLSILERDVRQRRRKRLTCRSRSQPPVCPFVVVDRSLYLCAATKATRLWCKPNGISAFTTGDVGCARRVCKATPARKGRGAKESRGGGQQTACWALQTRHDGTGYITLAQTTSLPPRRCSTTDQCCRQAEAEPPSTIASTTKLESR